MRHFRSPLLRKPCYYKKRQKKCFKACQSPTVRIRNTPFHSSRCWHVLNLSGAWDDSSELSCLRGDHTSEESTWGFPRIRAERKRLRETASEHRGFEKVKPEYRTRVKMAKLSSAQFLIVLKFLHFHRVALLQVHYRTTNNISS